MHSMTFPMFGAIRGSLIVMKAKASVAHSAIMLGEPLRSNTEICQLILNRKEDQWQLSAPQARQILMSFQ